MHPVVELALVPPEGRLYAIFLGPPGTTHHAPFGPGTLPGDLSGINFC